MIFPLSEYISTHDNYCDGYGAPGASGRGYFASPILSVGKTKKSLSHEGSTLLDEIDAFDKAEANQIYFGQINMITVSSFCGLPGALWGYHVVRSQDFGLRHPLMTDNTISYQNTSASVYSLKPVQKAAKALFGTPSSRRFILIPGGHIPCAAKSVEAEGPKRIYAGLAVGIPEDFTKNACLFMEDTGEIPDHVLPGDLDLYKSKILKNLAMSVLRVGINQDVKYKEILVDMDLIEVFEGEIGCALIAAPYFTIAKNGIPQNNPELLKSLSLEDWEKTIFQS